MGESKDYDVVIVGGGAAGLSGALALARARRSVLVVDAGRPRNAPAAHAHNYLGLDGVAPQDLLAAGRADVTGYGGEIVSGRVVSARRRQDGRFDVLSEDGTVYGARRLLITTGLVDELPQLPGMAELWGRDVLHCPYCHGWEVRDQAIGILAGSPMAVHQALLWSQWSKDVTLFLHTAAEPSEEQYEELAARGVSVVDGEVEALEIEDGRLAGVRLAGGKVIARQALAVAPRFTAVTDVLATLGLKSEDTEVNGAVIGSSVPSDPTGATTVPGVWVAGNVTDIMAQLITSAADGLRAGATINFDLINEEVRRAVEVRAA
ncbi:NAD(P)/FAD-dependent oxidoreductase [Actinomadura sp. 9N407]|uniref:NAD(P)/FAD-dependent oxidoreductase n=1 Tax=Actinomadura sp. 9N407 TaxID=3375154 RepID=UPI0037BB0184